MAEFRQNRPHRAEFHQHLPRLNNRTMVSPTHGSNRHLDAYVERVGIQCLVVREGKILLGQRRHSFGEGSWGLPGGQLEQGESIYQAATRELLEETGLLALQWRVAVLGDAVLENNFHIQIGLLIEN